MSDESSQRTGTPSDTNSIQTQSPEPEPTTPLVNNEGNESLKTEVRENGVEEATLKKEGEDAEKSESSPPQPPPVTEAVENLQTSAQQDSEDVVVTSVTVEVNRESPVAVCDGSECTIKNQNDVEGEKMEEEKEGGDAPKSEERESQEAKTEGETSEKKDKSTLAVEKVPTKGGDGEEEGSEGVEVLISQEPRSNSFSVNVIDTDEYSSSEDESTQPPPFVETESKGAANATPTQEVTSSGEPPKANGDCPTITVEKPEGQKEDEEGKEKRSGSESSSEGERLSPPIERRRCKLY